ncbi:hypothetical protein MMC25_008328 [Agyrium rufum]|nr:hypothetical protein [Agyrium rufum]
MGVDQTPSGVLAAGATFLALGVVAVAARFYVRTRQRVGYGPDDWLALLAMILVIGLGIDMISGVRTRGFAYPTSNMSQSISAAKHEYAFQSMQILAVGFTKLSFVYFYRRIFVTGRTSNTRYGVVTIVAIVMILAWMTSFFFAFIFDCGTQFSAHWTVALLRTKCDKGLEAELGLAISDFLTDLIVLVLPIPMVTLVIIADEDSEAFGEKVDNDLLITKGLYWGMVEAGLALIACCLPTLNALFAKKSIESVIRSIRSAVSLGSMFSGRSEYSHHSDLRRTDTRKGRRQSTESESAIVSDYTQSGGSVETYALGNLDRTAEDPESTMTKSGKIRVDRSIEQSESKV